MTSAAATTVRPFVAALIAAVVAGVVFALLTFALAVAASSLMSRDTGGVAAMLLLFGGMAGLPVIVGASAVWGYSGGDGPTVRAVKRGLVAGCAAVLLAPVLFMAA